MPRNLIIGYGLKSRRRRIYSEIQEAKNTIKEYNKVKDRLEQADREAGERFDNIQTEMERVQDAGGDWRSLLEQLYAAGEAAEHASLNYERHKAHARNAEQLIQRKVRGGLDTIVEEPEVDPLAAAEPDEE